MAGEAFTVALVYFIFNTISGFYGHAFVTRPIVVVPILGAILGDAQAGLLLGAQMEAMFMGITTVGGSLPSDVFIAGTVTCAVVLLTGVDVAAGLAIASVVGVVGAMITLSIRLFITGSFVQVWDNFAAAGKEKAYVTSGITYQFFLHLVPTTVVFIAVAVGADALKAFMDSIPTFVTNGLTVASGMMPAIGICLLMNMLWSGKMAIYFFFGYAVPLYFGVNMTAMVVIAAFITFLQVYNQMDLRAVAKSAGSGEGDDLFD